MQVGKLINSQKKSRGGGPVRYKSKWTPGFLRGESSPADLPVTIESES